MAFIAKKFSFDGIPSETYNVLISSESGDTSINSSNNITIYDESIYRKSVPYFYGSSQSEVLTFPIQIFSPVGDGIDAPVGSKISSWLFGQSSYKRLQLIQCDMDSVYFNCFLLNPQTRRVGNKIVGYSATVQCDSPYAWEFEKSETYTYTTEIVDDDVIFSNFSDNHDYLYPSLVITMNTFGGDVTITNSSDDDREFEITGLAAGEVLTVNNDLGILTSSLDIRRLGNFNKNFFRLVQGKNEFNIYGNVASVVMTYSFQRRIT